MSALLFSRVGLFGTVAFSFPVAAVLVFCFGFDRQGTASVLSLIYGVGIPLALSTAFWPLAETRGWSRGRRVESLALVFLGMSYATHLSWELGWLLLHEQLAAGAPEAWAYPWWAYIDGGDARYAHPTGTLLALETLSVINGLVGVSAMVAFLRSGRQQPQAIAVMAATAVVHLYSASFYYLSELLDGLPNVDTTSFIATYIKFGLANASWVVAPWFVFRWAWVKLDATNGGTSEQN